jgi:hypothetical protein
MKRACDQQWDRLAYAALNARDALRMLPPRIDQVINHPAKAIELLKEIRTMAEDLATTLRLALKHPNRGGL